MDVARHRAQRLYQTALQEPDWQAGPFASQQGWTDSELAQALQELRALGLLLPTAQTLSGWTALSPESALRNLLLAQREHIDDLVSSVHRTHQSLTEVLADFQPLHTQRLSSAAIEVVTGAQEVSAVLADAAQGAGREVLSLHPGRALPAEILEEGLERDRVALGRGVAMRTIHLTSASTIPHLASYLDRLAEAGAQVRTAHTLPMRMIVVDGRLAIVPAPVSVLPKGGVGAGGMAAIVVRSEVLVGVLTEVFEHSWSNSALLMPTSGDDSRPAGRHLELLRMLAAGLTDEAISRKLGVSERTVRRLVSELTDRLGTTSRFQAGVCAVRLGWLDGG